MSISSLHIPSWWLTLITGKWTPRPKQECMDFYKKLVVTGQKYLKTKAQSPVAATMQTAHLKEASDGMKTQKLLLYQGLPWSGDCPKPTDLCLF